MADYNLKAKVTADTSGYTAGVDNVVRSSKTLSSTLASVGLAINGITASFKLVSAAFGSVSKSVSECANNRCSTGYKITFLTYCGYRRVVAYDLK